MSPMRLDSVYNGHETFDESVSFRRDIIFEGLIYEFEFKIKLKFQISTHNPSIMFPFYFSF